MKKLITSTILLLVGVGIGWTVAHYQARKNPDEYMANFPPNLRSFIETLGDMTTKMSEDEIRETFDHVNKYANQKHDELQIMTAWQGALAQHGLILLNQGKVEEAQQLFSDRIATLIQEYDAGKYKDTDLEELVAAVAKRAREENHSPTSGSSLHRGADAPSADAQVAPVPAAAQP